MQKQAPPTRDAQTAMRKYMVDLATSAQAHDAHLSQATCQDECAADCALYKSMLGKPEADTSVAARAGDECTPHTRCA